MKARPDNESNALMMPGCASVAIAASPVDVVATAITSTGDLVVGDCEAPPSQLFLPAFACSHA